MFGLLDLKTNSFFMPPEKNVVVVGRLFNSFWEVLLLMVQKSCTSWYGRYPIIY